jgi:hypothetical protein
MQAVGLPVGDVIQDIHRARHEAKSGEQREHFGYKLPILPAVAENDPDEKESVLDPLVWAHQADKRARQG